MTAIEGLRLRLPRRGLPFAAGIAIALLGLVAAYSVLRRVPSTRRSTPVAGLPELGSETRYDTGDADLDAIQALFLPTLVANHKEFTGRLGVVRGFGAGDLYPQVWLRDSATLLPLARYCYDREELTSWIEEHLAAQQPDGGLFDWIARGRPDAFRTWAPQVRELYTADGVVLSADKNTTESDQEASAVCSVYLAYQTVRDPAWLRKPILGRSLIERATSALEYVLAHRRDRTSGLVFGALTADWGDVSPTYPDQRAIYLDGHTPRALSLYASALAAQAARDLSGLYAVLGDSIRAQRWRAEAERLRAAIERDLWQPQRGFYRIHRLLTPALAHGFPPDDDVFAMGGHAVALLAGVGDDERARRIFACAEQRRTEYSLATIAATLLPPYRTGVFQHAAMAQEWQYQNGGQWDWYAGRFVRAEFERGHSERASEHLRALAHRVRVSGGLYEWNERDGTGRGSARYAGSAAALGDAVLHGLFGVSLNADRLDVRLRLGSAGGRLALLEPASGRALVLDERRANNDRLVVEYAGRGDDAGSISVRLPKGAQVREATLDGRAAPFGLETVGEDVFVSLATDWTHHRLVLELTLGHNGAIKR
jgi:hypothetical protein